MSRKFKVGDRVRVIGAINYREHIGKEATVIAEVNGACPRCGLVCSGLYLVDLPATNPVHVGCFAAYGESYLAPVYDGNEPVAWKDCIWQPAGIKA